MAVENPENYRLIKHTDRGDLWVSFWRGLRLMTRTESYRAMAIALATVGSNTLELIAVAAMLPFINLVVEPSSVHSNHLLRSVYQFVGEPAIPRLILEFGTLVMGLMFLSALTKWLLLYSSNHFISACQSRLAVDLLEECIHAPYSWFLSRNHAALGRMIYEDNVIWSRNIIQRALSMVSDGVTVLLALILVLKLSPKTGTAAMTLVGVLALLSFAVTRPLLIKWAAFKKSALELTALTVNQSLAGIRDVKLSARESFFMQIFSNAIEDVSTGHAEGTIWNETPPILLTSLGQMTLIGIALALWRAGVKGGELVSQLALLIVVTTKMVPAVSGLSSSFSQLWNAFPYIDGIRDLIESISLEKVRVAQRKTPGKPLPDHWDAVEFRGTGFQYPNSLAWALKGIELRFEHGLCYGIVGRSGAGKSTLVDLLVGLLFPSEGGVFIGNDSLQSVDLHTWQRQIGYVPQMPFITDDTLRANIAFGVPRNEMDDELIIECVRQAQMEDIVAGLPQGLGTHMGDRGSRFSGGQRQRIAIARALYKRPKILVFDEATSALDAITEREILKTLDNLRKKIMLVIIAHRLNTVSHCDQIVMLEQGRVVANGTYDELRESHPLFKKMLAELQRESGQPLTA
jgi:ATP-binding cassette, subfamily B, bacterial PglK